MYVSKPNTDHDVESWPWPLSQNPILTLILNPPQYRSMYQILTPTLTKTSVLKSNPDPYPETWPRLCSWNPNPNSDLTPSHELNPSFGLESLILTLTWPSVPNPDSNPYPRLEILFRLLSRISISVLTPKPDLHLET